MTIKSIILSIGIVAVVVGGFFAYMIYAPQGGVISGNEYIDTSLGYKFTIPVGWEFQQEESGNVALKSEDKSAVVGIVVQPTLKGLDEYVTSEWNRIAINAEKEGGVKKMSESDDMLSGHPAKKIEFQIMWDGTPVVAVMYITSYRGIGYSAISFVLKEKQPIHKRTIDSFFSSVTLTELD